MMNRFSTHCWLAAALALFWFGQSQWLSSGGLGAGRACADEIEDIGQDEPHFVGNQVTGGSEGTIEIGDDDGASGGTMGGHAIVNVGKIDELPDTSGGVIGTFFFVGFEFQDASVVPDHGIWANNFGTVLVSELPSDLADYSVWANNFGYTGPPPGPAATYGYPGMMDAGDYTDWANHFGQSGDGMLGDFNADGTVNILDKLEWDRYFGQIYTPPVASGAAAVRGASLTAAPVPEPGGLALATLALFVLAAFARMTRLRSK